MSVYLSHRHQDSTGHITAIVTVQFLTEQVITHTHRLSSSQHFVF